MGKLRTEAVLNFSIKKDIVLSLYLNICSFFYSQSKSLADAGYESLWYNMLPRHSKKILFMIMRSQKHLTITAGGVLNLTLETFANVS